MGQYKSYKAKFKECETKPIFLNLRFLLRNENVAIVTGQKKSYKNELASDREFSYSSLMILKYLHWKTLKFTN